MAEKYREFDVESTTALSDVIIKGFRFTRRELVLGVTTLVCLLVIIILAALLGSANSRGEGADTPQALQGTSPATCYTPACLRTSSHVLDLLGPNTTAHPCEDFYTFACGNFPRLHPLRPDQSEVTTVQLLYDKNQEKLRRLVEATPSTTDPDHYEAKLKSFYTSCIDHYQREGLKGSPFLEKVVGPSGGWWVLEGDVSWPPSDYSFQRQLEKIHVDFWTDVFFTFTVSPDWLDWNKATIEIFLGGLGLGFYSYDYENLVGAYRQYISNVGSLLIRDASLNVTQEERSYRLHTFVSDALYVESELALLLKDANYEEDPHSLDRRPTLSELNKNSSGVMDWQSLFTYMFNSSSLVKADSRVVVYEQDYVQKFTAWIRDLHPSNKTRILNNYMVWRLADTFSRFLSWDYVHQYFKSKEMTMGGVEVPPIWHTCLLQLDLFMEDAMGALFVRDHFSDKNRAAAHEVTDYVKQALQDSLHSQLHWMSPDTRQTARHKISKSLIKLGYPDYMRNETKLNKIYTSLTIDKGDYFGNILSVHGLFRQYFIQYLSRPNDRSVWVYPTYSMGVEYYSPWKELIVPAGTMQPPIFDHNNPPYMNFGSMGALVGRELTHAVDEIGNSFLLDGSHFGEWWSANTTERYKQVRQCMVKAYDKYRMGPYPDLGLTTNVTVPDHYIPTALSESSGLQLAFRAYQKWTRNHTSEKDNRLPGLKFTKNEMFFISYAQTFCANRDPMEEAFKVWLRDHVTDKIRVNGALSQVPEFQNTFKCPATSKMVAKTRCNLY